MADAGPSDDTQTQTETPFITPVIGIISNEDVPVMFSANKRVMGDSVDAGKTGGEQPEERKVAKPSGGIKRKQPDRSESDEEVEVDRRSLASFASLLKLERESEKDTLTEDSKREDLGLDLSLHFVSCLNRQPVIVLHRLPVSPDRISESSGASKSPRTPSQRRRKPAAFPASDDKE